MPSQETPYQRLRRKIEALIRHSRGTDNEDEARIFVQKAAELMEKCAQLGYTPGEDEPTSASRPEAGSEAFGMEVYDIGSTRHCYIGLFGAVCDYFHCTAIFLTKHKYRKAEVYGSNANRRQALVMYEFWKKQCIALGKRANAETDELLSKSPFAERGYSRQRMEGMAFTAFVLMLEREITNPSDISKGRPLNPILIESETPFKGKKGEVAIARGKEWLPHSGPFFGFFTINLWHCPYVTDLVKENMSVDARPVDETSRKIASSRKK